MYEYVGGGNLSGWLVQLSGKPAAERVPQVMAALKQLGRGVGVFHGLPTPLAHRDLKPSNILLDETTRRLRITDFGIGAVAQKAANGRESRGETSKGERLLSYLRGAHTPTYSSPEQRSGADPDPRDDVHALGVIGYQLLTGDLSAAPGVDLADDLRDAGTPADLIDVIAACVARKRERRPANALDLGARLDAVGGVTTVSPPPPPPPHVPTRPPAGPAKPTVVNPPPPKREPQPGEERRVALPGGLEMAFCWIPPGTCQLGSPKAEQDAVAAQLVKRGDWLAAESEANRGTHTTSGFWLGKYPVTQAEWDAVTGELPSHFQAGVAEVKGVDTTRLPVENVSWEMCQTFLDQLSEVAPTFGPGLRFGLPHEDQWEYACRGGRGNNQPFYWGAELNGTQADVDGNEPFGTAAKGRYLGRPCLVDFTNWGKYPAHPWGLHHMTGNVWEWCENAYDKTGAIVLRGGSWLSNARRCRSACRGRDKFDARRRYYGIRVCLRPD